MTRLCSAFCLLLGAGIYPEPVFAGTERVPWPENYASHFVRYLVVDKPAAKNPAKVRFMYVNPQALAAAQIGQPLPNGTVLIMEDHPVKMGADDKPVTDSKGRFVALPEISNVFVQQKQSGWGNEYPEELRNGDWEYAWFLADGTRKPDAKFEGCFSCHKGQATADFNFTFTPFLSRIKP